MKFFLIIRKLQWLWVLGFIGYLIGNPILIWFSLFALFLFISPTFWQSMAQICGNFYVKIACGSSLPSKENYTCKGDYILPFTGKWTLWNGGVDKELSHSWDIVGQRYAYDFVIVEDNGKYFDGDGTQVQNYLCYGKDIVAPADGVVVKLSNKHKDSRVSNGQKVFCDTWDIRGNYIVIKHHDKEYSTTAHIMQNSFTVQVGDQVKQEQVIAKCGNSGNTSEPHIHFQLQTGKSFFFSAGLPIAFSNIKAEESLGYQVLSKLSCAGNLQTVGNKSYLGRGLNVSNADDT